MVHGNAVVVELYLLQASEQINGFLISGVPATLGW